MEQIICLNNMNHIKEFMKMILDIKYLIETLMIQIFLVHLMKQSIMDKIL